MHRDDPAIDDLLAKQAIAERLYLYARGWDRLETALILDTFHPDATVRQGTLAGNARELMTQWIAACATRLAMTHLVTNVLVLREGETARSEAHFLSHHRRAATPARGEDDWFIKGRYLDAWARRDDGVWRVTDRTMVLDFERVVAPADAELQRLGPAVRGQYHPHDPLYALMA